MAKKTTRERMLAATLNEAKVKTEVGTVLVRGTSTQGKDRLQAAALEGTSWRAPLLREHCFDPDTREPLFEDGDDVGAIPSRVTEPLVDAIVRLSGMTADELEELEGN